MTHAITLVNTNADTFQVWVDKTNEIANVISDYVVTANTDANGSVTAGNSQFTGIFSANTLTVVTEMRGGNVQTTDVLTISSNVVLSGNKFTYGNSTINASANSSSFTVANSTVSYSYIKPTAIQKAANNFWLNANGSWVDKDLGFSVTTTGTTAQLLDTWLLADNYGIEYTISVNDNVANNRSIFKALVLQDEGNAYLNEYGVIDSNGVTGTLTANANTTAVSVYYTPVSTNTTIVIRKYPNRK